MGAMGEGSRKVQIASTYRDCGILIYVAVGHSDISRNGETSSLYDYEYGKCLESLLHGGDGGKFKEGSES